MYKLEIVYSPKYYCRHILPTPPVPQTLGQASLMRLILQYLITRNRSNYCQSIKSISSPSTINMVYALAYLLTTSPRQYAAIINQSWIPKMFFLSDKL